ncbi:DUF6083 domain-containing protein [Streptomyces sp. NBC_01187]|uniref:DUF6083 domain-containing protein n=1 Tax=Streptomyces sp. NBC_01187 TaxID=2903766 RepID=UPI00386F8E23|nr:DUF6083 domain-containing protein [Streptomyces sp. NBC_01187]
MADPQAEPRCRTCRQPHPTVTDRGSPHGQQCTPCWSHLQTHCDNEQALEEGATGPPPPVEPRCRHCDTLQDRHETGYNRWVLLEPDMPVPSHIVPAGHRWTIADDGIAINTGTQSLPAGTVCRIPHALVCPRDDPPDQLPPFFTALWQENERRYWRNHPPDIGDLPTAGPAA